MQAITQTYEITDNKLHILQKIISEEKQHQIFGQQMAGYIAQDSTHRRHRFTLSQYQREAITAVLSDAFVSKGLDNPDEPNDLGVQIEELIDLLNPYSG